MEYKDCYNYKKNTNVVATPKGDIVITMNREIYVSLLNNLYDAHRWQEHEGRKATSEDTVKLWDALNKL